MKKPLNFINLGTRIQREECKKERILCISIIQRLNAPNVTSKQVVERLKDILKRIIQLKIHAIFVTEFFLLKMGYNAT